MIKKGIITKNLCLKQTSAGVDIILKGQAYKLGYYAANEELENYTNLPTSDLENKCITKSKYPNLKLLENKGVVEASQLLIKEKQKSFKSFINTQNSLPKEELKRLADLLSNYRLRANDILELSDEDYSEVFPTGSIKIKANGYADGVRNTTEEYDHFIAKRVCSESEGKVAFQNSSRSKEDPRTLTSYFDKTVDIKSIDTSKSNHLDAFLSSWNSYTGEAKTSSPGTKGVQFLSRYRNTFLAKMRADTLATTVYDEFKNRWSATKSTVPNDALLIRNSEVEISDQELNPDSTYMCKGFCNMRRGAKLNIEFPFSEPKESENSYFNSLQTHFEGPVAVDQLNMNKFALQRLVNDFSDYMTKNKKNPSVKEEHKFIVDNIKGRPVPDSYRVLSVNADYTCSGNDNCKDIKKSVAKFNQRSFDYLLQTLRANIIQGENAFSISSRMAAKIINPKVSSYLNGIHYNTNIARQKDKLDCNTSNSIVTHNTDLYLVNAMKGQCGTFQKILSEKFYEKLPSQTIRNSITNNKQDLGLASIMLLGNDETLISNFLKKYSNILPEGLKTLLSNHLESTIPQFRLLFAQLEDGLRYEFKKRFESKMETAIVTSLFNLPMNLSVKKELEKNTPFLTNSMDFSAPLIDYLKLHYCSRLNVNNKECPFYKDKSEKALTPFNHPFFDLELSDSNNINYIQDLLSFTSTGKDLESLKLELENNPFDISTSIKHDENEVRLNSNKIKKSSTAAYFEGAIAANPNHFKTSIPLGNESIYAEFIKEKLSIPDNISLKYFEGEKEISKTEKFDDYFKPIIQWTQNSIYNSIDRSSVSSKNFKFKPKMLRRLNYNSQTSTNRFGSEYFYPLFFSNKENYRNNDIISSYHHFFIKNYYRQGLHQYLANQIIKDFGEDIKIFEKTKNIDNDQLKQLNQKFYSSQYGFLNESDYNSELKALSELLKAAFAEDEIDDIPGKYLVSFVSNPGEADRKQSFVYSNFKVISYLVSRSLDKSISLKELSESEIHSNYKSKTPSNGLGTFTTNAIKALDYLNEVFVWESIYWYNAFDHNGEQYSDPWYAKKGTKPTNPAYKKDLDHEELAQVLNSGPTPSINGAQVSTIFSFANYSDAMADILNSIHGHPSKFNWAAKKRYKRIYKRVPENLKYLYFTPKNITGAELEKNSSGVSGWMHTACKTGTVFPYIPNSTTEFHYQTRYRSQRNFNTDLNSYYSDYPSAQKYRHPYDDTFLIPTDKNTKLPFHTLINLKRPNSYLIPNCNKCGCLKKKFENGDALDTLLKTAKRFDFTSGYKWIDFNSPAPFAEKRFDVNNSLNDQREIAEKVYASSTDKSISVPSNSGDYCLYSPLVPQSHEVGTGSSSNKDSLFEDMFADQRQSTDFLLDALEGVKVASGESYLDPAIAYYNDKLEEFDSYLESDKTIKESGYSKSIIRGMIKNYKEELESLKTKKTSSKYTITPIKGLVDVVTDPTKIDKIYTDCNNYLHNFPMSPAMCNDTAASKKPQLKESFNWCTSLPDGVAAKLGFTGDSCLQTASSIFSGGKAIDSNEIKACRLLSKTYDDNGNIIEYDKISNSIKLTSPDTIINDK